MRAPGREHRGLARHRIGLRTLITRRPRATLVTLSALAVAGALAVAITDNPLRAFLARIAAEPALLREALHQFGVFAPIGFIALQTLQVVVAPIPGDVTGLLGGFLFGVTQGFVYSTAGLSVGSLVAFWVARRLGTSFARRLVSERVWQRIGFVVETRGAIACFVIFLIPGLPKDTACYLFGLSPMPLWVFALTSTAGRMPGTWMLSAQGAHVATGDYRQLLMLTAAVAAIALPLYWYRVPILARVRRRQALAHRPVRHGSAVPIGWH